MIRDGIVFFLKHNPQKRLFMNVIHKEVKFNCIAYKMQGLYGPTGATISNTVKTLYDKNMSRERSFLKGKKEDCNPEKGLQ